MLMAACVLAMVAGILCLISLIPQAQTWPVINVAALLLAVAVFVMSYR